MLISEIIPYERNARFQSTLPAKGATMVERVVNLWENRSSR